MVALFDALQGFYDHFPLSLWTVAGLVGVFFVGWALITREFLAWFLRVNKTRRELKALQSEVARLQGQIERLTRQPEALKSSDAKPSVFPLSH